MAIDIVDILLARAGSSRGGSSGGSTVDPEAVTAVTVEENNTSTSKGKRVRVRKRSISNAYEVVKNYTSRGNNEDGSMTQKAITAELESLEDQIASTVIVPNLGAENAGKIVIVGDKGELTPGSITEDQIKYGGDDDDRREDKTQKKTLGLSIDYGGRTFERLSDAVDLSMGIDFDAFLMYGGRKRCNVADDGTIMAFLGDSSYIEDGSNGQVMIYQPKFYYKREIIETKTNTVGESIVSEKLYLSYTQHNGYKLHPLFQNEAKEEIEFILIPAYEGSAYDVSARKYDLEDSVDVDFNTDKLSSIAGAKPISGANKEFTAEVAEQLAKNRGAGWHITNMQVESAQQMLMMIEFGMMNGQTALEKGICEYSNGAGNCAAITGSTTLLGNESGAATATTQTANGSTYTYTTAGKRAISYRGFENPWGNMWRIIGGLNIQGNGSQSGGVPYICTDYNYTPEKTGNNYVSAGFSVPSGSTMGSYAANCGNGDLDWLYIPSAYGSPANSALPIGDSIWTGLTLNGIHMGIIGGYWAQQQSVGPFSYGFDKDPDSVTRSKTARLMFVPAKNAIYEANIAKWKMLMGV